MPTAPDKPTSKRQRDALEAEAKRIRERLDLIRKAAAAITDPAMSRDIEGMLYVLVDSSYGGITNYEMRAGVGTSLDRLAEVVSDVSDLADRDGYTDANLLRQLDAEDRLNLLRDISGALWLLASYVLPGTPFWEHAEASRGDLEHYLNWRGLR